MSTYCVSGAVPRHFPCFISSYLPQSPMGPAPVLFLSGMKELRAQKGRSNLPKVQTVQDMNPIQSTARQVLSATPLPCTCPPLAGLPGGVLLHFESSAHGDQWLPPGHCPHPGMRPPQAVFSFRGSASSLCLGGWAPVILVVPITEDTEASGVVSSAKTPGP